MDDSTRYTADADVISTTTGDELVLLSLTTETYYGLNPVGARIWALLQEGNSVDGLTLALTAEFDVEPDMLREDIRAIVQDMLKNSLVVAGASGDA